MVRLRELVKYNPVSSEYDDEKKGGGKRGNIKDDSEVAYKEAEESMVSIRPQP